ncbi:alpha/beta fold hydrolase, partial [Saccharopolyspora erythraea]
ARARAVVADLPGQPGLSSAERIPRGARLQWYGRWLTELIDKISDEQVVVMGHSLGAAIAPASDSPRVGRQVLVSPGGLTRLRLSPAVVNASAAWVLRRSPAVGAGLLRTMHGPDHTPRRMLVDWMTLVAKHVRTSTDPGKAPIGAPDVDRSVLVGDHDVFLPVRALAPAVRDTLGIEPHVVPSAGHLVIEEQPARLVSACLG